MNGSFLVETWRAAQIGITDLPWRDPVTDKRIQSPEQAHRFFSSATRTHERLHGPIQFPSELDLAKLVNHAPELERVIAHIRFGHGKLNSLSPEHRESVEKFLRGKIVLHAINFSAPTFEQLARHAEWNAINSSKLSDIFAWHGGFFEQSTPDEFLFTHPHFVYNKTYREGSAHIAPVGLRIVPRVTPLPELVHRVIGLSLHHPELRKNISEIVVNTTHPHIIIFPRRGMTVDATNEIAHGVAREFALR